MVGVFDDLERRTLAERLHERLQQREVGELVACALQEQHRDLHVGQVLAALVRRLARRMQREADEDDAAHTAQRRCGLRLRGHAAAERLAAGDERHAGQSLRCRIDSRAHRRMRKLRRVGPLRAALHVRELVAQRRDAAFGQAVRDRGHERMRHAGAGAVGEHAAGACVARYL